MASAQAALSVLARNGVGAPGRPPAPAARAAEAPALVVDPRTAELAATVRDAAQAAERPPAEARPDYDAETEGRLRMTARVFRESADDADKWVEQVNGSLAKARNIVRLYEETGELYSSDMNGDLKVYVPHRPWREGEKEGIIQQTREAIPRMEKALPELAENAKQKRTHAEAYAASLSERLGGG